MGRRYPKEGVRKYRNRHYPHKKAAALFSRAPSLDGEVPKDIWVDPSVLPCPGTSLCPMTASNEVKATDLKSDIGKSRLTAGNPMLADRVIGHVDPVDQARYMAQASESLDGERRGGCDGSSALNVMHSKLRRSKLWSSRARISCQLT